MTSRDDPSDRTARIRRLRGVVAVLEEQERRQAASAPMRRALGEYRAELGRLQRRQR